MSDVVAFTRAHLEELEQTARAATPGPWTYKEDRSTGTGEAEVRAWSDGPHPGETWIVGTGPTNDPESIADATHIVLNDPAAVLRDVAATRRLVDLHDHQAVAHHRDGEEPIGCIVCHHDRDHGLVGGGWCETIRLVAARWSNHPDHRPEWTP